MKRICKNCEHFMQVSSTSEHIWGDCIKPTSSIKMSGKEEYGAFMWADKTCNDFKPKKSPSNSPRE
jgi:hypothetical protein